MPLAVLAVLVVAASTALPVPRTSSVGAMSTARASHQATLLQSGAVLVTGGCTARGCEAIVPSADVYLPATRTFRSVGAMASPRAAHAAVALRDGRVLVAGGWTGREAMATTEMFDPATGRFATTASLAVARTGPVGVLLRDGRVLIVGGQTGAAVAHASSEVFDPATGRWSTVGPMRSARTLHDAVALADGRVLVTGGRDAQGVLRSAEVFDPATGRFEATGEMTVPRYKHAAVRLDDGTVMIVGGSDERDFRARYTSTEIYDPATGTFKAGPNMEAQRFKVKDAIVALPSGRVLAAGGAPRPELYEPSSRRFVASDASVGGSYSFATATVLRGGDDVLLLGGYDDQIQPTASAWQIRIE